MDEKEQKVHRDIAKYGWHAVSVFDEGDAPDFQYSIGFQRTFGHPEVLILGLEVDVMHGMLDRIAYGLSAGKRYDMGVAAPDILVGYSCLFRPIPKSRFREYLGWALWYYGEESLGALQCIWPDLSGRFPWDPDASDEVRRREPILHPG
jgi:hypothetical protein